MPIIAADTFRHMFLFKNFKRIHRTNVLEMFVKDVLSGKHPPMHEEEKRRACPAAALGSVSFPILHRRRGRSPATLPPPRLAFP
jgi:hypothetical protein